MTSRGDPPQRIEQRCRDSMATKPADTKPDIKEISGVTNQGRMATGSDATELSMRLAKCQPIQNIPTFSALHGQSAMALTEPVPGRLQFPGCTDIHGKRVPIKAMFAEPQKRILPSKQEPLWKQMLEYCQRWGVWVALVEDEKRRTELMEWVTVKMREAWETGITLGHCGDPTGHTSCCLAHASSSDCPNGKKQYKQRETRKREVDVGKQPAPFACDGIKLDYAILNEELDRVGITTDTIIRRVASGVDEGEELLEDVTSRLGGRPVSRQDWTSVKFPHHFNPRLNPRNLFMFCLWEVQRCRDVVERARKFMSNSSLTVNRHNAQQRRADIHQQRADEHLALAIELDDRENADQDQDMEAQEDTLEIEKSAGKLRRSKRTVEPASIVEIPDDDDENGDGIEEVVAASDERKEDEAPVSVSDQTEIEAGDEVEHKDKDEHKYDSGTSGGDSDEDLDRSAQREDSEALDAVSTGEKRAYRESDSSEGPDKKKSKSAFYAFAGHDNQSSNFWRIQDQAARSGVIHCDVPPTPGQILPPAGMTTYNMSAQSPVTPHHYTQGSLYATNNQGVAEQMLQRYLAQHCQRRINDILVYNRRAPLNWTLGSWSQIKTVLEHIGFNEGFCNQEVNNLRSGFQQWAHSVFSQPAPCQNTTASSHVQQTLMPSPATPSLRQSTHIPVSAPSPRGPTSHDNLEATRKGLSFRYFDNTTPAERERTNNAIMDYYNTILEDGVRRFGFYVVFCDPQDKTREVAHGFWNQIKGRRCNDAAWFYDNTPRPLGFRSDEHAYAIPWGYALPPPKPSRSKAKATATAKAEYDGSRDEPEHAHKTSRRGTSRKRRSYKVEDDSDDDYRPGGL